MTDRFEWWRGAVAAVATQTYDEYLKSHPINQEEPMLGFYETRHKDPQTDAIRRGGIAIYCDPERDDAVVGNEDRTKLRTGDDLLNRWPFAARRPISYEVYKSWYDNGKYPDEIEREKIARADGLNDVGDMDPFDLLKDRIADLTREAQQRIDKGAAKSIDESNDAADLADRLKKLEARAESLRKEEKQPHLNAGAEVDLKWVPLTKAAGDAKTNLKRLVITPFEVAEQNRRIAEAAKVRAQAEADAAAARAEATKKGEEPPPPAPLPPIAPIKRTAGVTATRKVGLRDEKTAIIDDYAKTLAYFAANSKVKELIQTLANASVKQGTTPDGCRLHIEQVAA